MAFFTQHVLTESLIEEHSDKVLNFPIDIPETLKALLSKVDQTAIVNAIIEQRQNAYHRLKPDYAPQEMLILQEHHLWYPLFQEQLAQEQAQEEGVLDLEASAGREEGVLDLEDLVRTLNL